MAHEIPACQESDFILVDGMCLQLHERGPRQIRNSLQALDVVDRLDGKEEVGNGVTASDLSINPPPVHPIQPALLTRIERETTSNDRTNREKSA